MVDGFDHAVLGQAPPCAFHEQSDPQFGRDRWGRSRREEFVPHCSENCWRALQGTIGGGPTYVERPTEDRMSPGEIRACYRLYAAHRRSRLLTLVGHFGHLRKMLASFAAQLFGRGALAAR
jgi:hypothetical protein